MDAEQCIIVLKFIKNKIGQSIKVHVENLKEAWEFLKEEPGQDNLLNIQRNSTDGIIYKLTIEEQKLLQKRLFKSSTVNEISDYFKARYSAFTASLTAVCDPVNAYKYSEELTENILGSGYKQKFAVQVNKERKFLNYLLLCKDNKELGLFGIHDDRCIKYF